MTIAVTIPVWFGIMLLGMAGCVVAVVSIEIGKKVLRRR